MSQYAFRIVNVFAESPLAGNPLCVFEDGHGLDDATMQALALQFNLSETTFVLPSEKATARVPPAWPGNRRSSFAVARSHNLRVGSVAGPPDSASRPSGEAATHVGMSR